MPFKSKQDAPPQCHAVDRSVSTQDPTISSTNELKSDGFIISNGSKVEPQSRGGNACLNSLSDDILLNIMLYCGPADVEEGLKLVNRRFHNATSLSATLWKEFCVLTGKSTDDAQFTIGGMSTNYESLSSRVVSEEMNEDFGESKVDAGSNYYRGCYFRNPCVPIDFSSIQEALKHCPRTPSSSMKIVGVEANNASPSQFSTKPSVVLMPGVYDEGVSIGGETWTAGQAFSEEVAIRAAFPQIGATIVSRKDGARDQPCISISTCDDDTIGGVQKGFSVRLSHLRILHSSLGADIWGGNTAINVNGPRAQVVIESCVLKSNSGRGLVATNQAVVELYRTSILDCAATGFYLGDWGSRARISECNIVRNGFGSERLRSPSADDEEAGNILDRIVAHTRMLERGLPLPREEYDAVPPGHSGVYIESSMCWIDDSLCAGNCLTGLSVVRGGFVSLSASDMTENGSTPILIEDAHDVRDAFRMRGQGISIRGGVVEGPEKNNFTSLQSDGKKMLFGGVIRKSAPFFHEAL